jgi:MFS family permease
MTSSSPASARPSTGGIVVLIVLSLAMFIYVIDTTLMNVSISALVEDLDTEVGAVQAAITLYTLTMASFMLTGGKLGDIWGSKRAFRIGLVIYGVGTTMTALAFGAGIILAPATARIMSTVPQSKSGVGSGLSTVTHRVGGTVGIAMHASIQDAACN